MSLFHLLVSFELVRWVVPLGLYQFQYRGVEEPRWSGPHLIFDKYIEQPLDHFDHLNNKTWRMRYYEEDRYYNSTGPIFIMIGGEWTINPGYLQKGFMFNLGKKYGALMFYTEHRYYGKSKPTGDINTEALQYLNVDQALADLAYFINNIKKEKKALDSKVIVFGGSYAGNVAAWMRIKYPHLVQGAVASSAPVYAKADFHEYYDEISKTLNKTDPQCYENTKEAFKTVRQMIDTPEGRKELKNKFKLCYEPNQNSSKDIGYFMNFLTEAFSGAVQYCRNKNGTNSVQKICSKLTSEKIKSPVDKLASLFGRPFKCYVNYEGFLRKLSIIDWKILSSPVRQWTFQTCVEYGYFQTSNEADSVFGKDFPLSFFTDLCQDLFGPTYNQLLLDRGIKRTNLFYGGKRPDITNVIFVNGDVDPWHTLSVLEDLNAKTPSILVKGAAHCQDMTIDPVNDVPGLAIAREKMSKVIDSWLNE